MAFMAHEAATIDPGARIGEATRMWHSVHIRAGARIGARCSLGHNVFVGIGVVIGDNVKVQNSVKS